MPLKKTYYLCSMCNTIFKNENDALICEERHLSNNMKTEGFTQEQLYRLYNLIESRNADPCDYCKNAYYVYGCEQECSFRNSGKCFSCGPDKGKKFEPKVEDIVKKFVTHKEEKENLNDTGIKW